MPSTGYLQLRIYASFAQLPLADVSVTVTATDGTAVAMRLSDASGKTQSIAIPTPDPAQSQSPLSGSVPYALVNLRIQHPGYSQILARDVQIFPDTVTLQEIELIPLAELPALWSKEEDFTTPPQNL